MRRTITKWNGRPPEYSREIYDETVDYIENVWHKHGAAMPTLAGLAVYLSTGKSTLSEWAVKYPEYRKLLDIMNSIQEAELIQGGINGAFNPSITKLILTRHGYADKVETNLDITSGGESLAPATFKGVESGGRVIEHEPQPKTKPMPEFKQPKRPLPVRRASRKDDTFESDSLTAWRNK